VLEYSPDNFRAYSNLGAIHVVKGNYQQAIDELQRSIQIRPTSGAYTNLGAAYFSLRRFVEAAHTYEAGLQLDNKDDTIWSNLGDARYWSGNLRERANEAHSNALDLAGQKLRVNPRDKSALGLLATCYAMSGNKPSAQLYLNRALAVTPNDSVLLYQGAVVYSHFGETDLAMQFIAKSLAAGYPAKAFKSDPNFDQFRNDPRFVKLTGT